MKKHILVWLLVLAIVIPAHTAPVEAASQVVSASEIRNAAAAYGISTGSKAYKALQSINTRYASLASQPILLFFFEGVGYSEDPALRENAMCVLVKNHKIVYINMHCSTLPDFPFDVSSNGGWPVSTVEDGIYDFTTVNKEDGRYHYASLRLRQAHVLQFYSKGKYTESYNASEIEVHTRSRSQATLNNINSVGCIQVGFMAEYYDLLYKMDILNSRPTSGYVLYDNIVNGKVIVDHTYATWYLIQVGYPHDAIIRIGGSVFPDVGYSSVYFYKPVYWAAHEGITLGYEDGTFRPTEACTRAQVVMFLWRLAGKPEPEGAAGSFTDLDGLSANFVKAIQWAAEQGITKGYADGTFRPDEACKREHVVTFLWRFAGKPAASGSSSFTDVKTSAYYHKAVLWAVQEGITNGYDDGTFQPAATCLREHVVTFLYRYKK